MVVCGREDAQVVGGCDGGGVYWGGISDGGAVVGNGGLLDIISSGGTSEETILADDGINVRSWALEQVEEGTAVEVGLLEVQVELGTLCVLLWEEGAQELSLEALGDGILKLDLGIEGICGVPCLGER